MGGMTETAAAWFGRYWRWGLWGGAVVLLSLPAIAMQFTDEVRWDLVDFIVMGGLLAGCCGLVELGVRCSTDVVYRAGVVVATGTGFLQTWANLAVGLLGDEGDPENLWFHGLILAGLLGAAAVRFRAAGLAVVLGAMALAQAGLVAGFRLGQWEPGIVPTLGLALGWATAALLFRGSARRRVA